MILQPTAEQTWRILEGDFEAAIVDSQLLEQQGDIAGACEARYAAFRRLMELLPDDQAIALDWDDVPTRAALLLTELSAIDHFLTSDFELCAAMLELLLELDPEDHTEATKRLSYCYIALEEWELLDEIIDDISDKHAEKSLLKLWAGLRREGRLDEGEARHLRTHFPEVYHEFTAADHPADEAYLADIRQPRPSKTALARELWLQTEHLWAQFPDFIVALSGRKA